MKNIVAILAFVLFALTIFGADATSNSSLNKCRNDLKKEQSKLKSCKNQVDGKAKEISELAFDPTPEAIVKNLPQDYCSKFKKGGSRAGVLTQANGTQILTGICSNTPLGEIPKLENMPSTLIISPENGEKIKKNTPFNVLVHTTNVEFGFFSDPNSQYNAFPQALNDKGQIKGHQHVTIQFLGNKDNKTPPVATIFAFFKGLNDPSKTGKLEAPVELGLPKPGLYRMCTICSSNSHQSVVLPKAQRGATDDCIRFEIVD